jgi:hypothetical protein
MLLDTGNDIVVRLLECPVRVGDNYRKAQRIPYLPSAAYFCTSILMLIGYFVASSLGKTKRVLRLSIKHRFYQGNRELK